MDPVPLTENMLSERSLLFRRMGKGCLEGRERVYRTIRVYEKFSGIEG
jgi:hypothetical protein